MNTCVLSKEELVLVTFQKRLFELAEDHDTLFRTFAGIVATSQFLSLSALQGCRRTRKAFGNRFTIFFCESTI